jgi:hypothetical protein
MKKPHAPRVRELLKCHQFGLSTLDIASLLEIRSNTILKVLHKMPDCYVDRWATPNRGQYVAVWCLADVPKDCPYPTRNKAKPSTVWIIEKELS